MLRFHHHLRDVVKLVWWDVYCVNGFIGSWCRSFRLGRCRVRRKLWLQVWYLVCSYVEGWFLRAWLFWHLLLILRNYLFPAGGLSASRILLCVRVRQAFPSGFANKPLYTPHLKDTKTLLMWKRVQVGWHLIPHTNDTLPLILTNFQLQAEYGNTFSCQHDKVRDQECICTKLNSGILQHVLHSSLHDMQATVYQLFSSLIFQLCWRM